MSNASTAMTIAEFERLLEVYGADRTRWPVEARAGAGQLVARDRAARRLLAEAEALDRVLERAPLPSLAREAELAERIVAAARRSPRMVPSSRADATRPAPAAAGGGNVVSLSGPQAGSRRLPVRAMGGAAGALAASLLLGIYLGLSSLSQGVVPALEQLTGLTLTPGNAAVAQVDLLDEDLL